MGNDGFCVFTVKVLVYAARQPHVPEDLDLAELLLGEVVSADFLSF